MDEIRSKPTKPDRRFVKKQNRVWHVLSSSGVTLSKVPTKNILVYNAGFDNGTSREELYSLCTQYGDITDIVMIPKKSYSFVTFSTIIQAENAQERINGTKLASLENQKGATPSCVLYTFFVDEIPETTTKDILWPNGLILEKDFITEVEEKEILAAIKWDENNKEGDGELKHRRVKHYGYEFKYSVNNIDPDERLDEGIPPVCDRLIQTALSSGLIKHPPDQLTVNQYHPGQGIPPHIDTPEAFEDGLVSLSLGAQCVMEFSHEDGRHVSVTLPQRSLLVMSGESRYLWSHAITPRKSDIITSPEGGLTLSTRGTRTSLTFRKIIRDQVQKKKELEELGYIKKSTSPTENQIMREEDAHWLEKEHVHKVYEEIAGHFSQTRHTAWPRIAEFVRSLSTGTVLADIGCGNGKYLGLNKQSFEVGSDRSENLARICSERGHESFIGDVLSIPLRSDLLDVCLCIAVIHHLSTKARRLGAIKELVRVLTPGGKLLIYVWAMEQERHKVKSKYLKAKNCDQVHIDETSSRGTNPTSQDLTDSTKDGSFAREERPKAASFENCAFVEDISTVEGKDLETSTVTAKEISTECMGDDLVNSRGTTPISPRGTIHHPVDEGASCLENSERMNCCGVKIDMTDTKNVEEKLSSLSVHVNRTQFKQQDMLVPWQKKMNPNKETSSANSTISPVLTQTFHRFYHVFKQGELETLCSSVDNVEILKSYYDQGNWCVLLQKTKSEIVH